MKKRLLKSIGIVAILLVSLMSCKNYGPVKKYLKSINNDASRYWLTFINEYGIDAIDSDGETLLDVACDQNNYELIESILKSGADPDRSGSDLTNLCSKIKYLAYHIEHDSNYISPEIDIIKLLLKYDANPNIDEDILYWVSKTEKYKYELYDLLVKYNINQNWTGTTVSTFYSLILGDYDFNDYKYLNYIIENGHSFSIIDACIIADSFIENRKNQAQREYLKSLLYTFDDPDFWQLYEESTSPLYTIISKLEQKRWYPDNEVYDIIGFFLDKGFSIIPHESHNDNYDGRNKSLFPLIYHYFNYMRDEDSMNSAYTFIYYLVQKGFDINSIYHNQTIYDVFLETMENNSYSENRIIYYQAILPALVELGLLVN